MNGREREREGREGGRDRERERERGERERERGREIIDMYFTLLTFTLY